MTGWNTKELCQNYKISERTAQRWRENGEGPPWVRLGPRLILYPVADAEEWAASRKYRHRAEELARKAS